MRLFPIFLLLTGMLFLTSCGSMEYNSTNSPHMVVVVDHTPFYHNGPAQGSGPDLSLAKGDEVEVLRREIGYSFVRISDGQNGYVANEAIAVAPPVPPAVNSSTPQPKPSAVSTNSTGTPGFRY